MGIPVKDIYQSFKEPSQLQGVQEKLFFTIHCSPSLACNAVRDLQSSQHKASVHCTVTPIGWKFFVQPIAAECRQGRGCKIREFLAKSTIFNEHSVYKWRHLYYIPGPKDAPILYIYCIR